MKKNQSDAVKEPTTGQLADEGEKSPIREVADSRSWVGELAGIGVFATGAAYALGYVAQGAYYNAFGMTPEQVGVDKIAALLRITPLAALFGVVTPLAVAAALATGRWLQREIFDLLPGSWFRRIPLFVLIPGIAAIPVTSIVDSARRDFHSGGAGARPEDYWMWNYIQLAVLIWLVVAAMWWVFSKVAGVVLANFASAVAVVAIACLVLLQFVSVPATELRDHPSPDPSLRLMMIGLPQSYAEIDWKKPEEAPGYVRANPDRIFLVLGETSGRYTLYEYCGKRIYTVDSSEAHVVRVLPPDDREEKVMNSWLRRAFPCRP